MDYAPCALNVRVHKNDNDSSSSKKSGGAEREITVNGDPFLVEGGM